MEGWIKLHRAIQNNSFWNSEPFTRGQAWVDLLLLANHKESFFYKRNNKVIVKRGQVGRSEVELSDRWSWSRTKVRKFLKDLEKEQQIKVIKSRITQLITVINYDLYQSEDDKRTTERQQKDNKSTTEKHIQECKERKERKEKHSYLSGFEKIKNGEIIRTTALDNNFNFSLFPNEWTKDFQNAVLKMWRYLEGKEYNPDRWGNVGTISSQLKAIKQSLERYSEKEVIAGFEACMFASKKSWHFYIEKAKAKADADQKQDIDNGTYEPPYTLPIFKNQTERFMYFLARFNEYKVLANDRPNANTKLTQQALYKKQAEQVCYMMEQEQPELTKINIQWQATR